MLPNNNEQHTNSTVVPLHTKKKRNPPYVLLKIPEAKLLQLMVPFAGKSRKISWKTPNKSTQRPQRYIRTIDLIDEEKLLEWKRKTSEWPTYKDFANRNSLSNWKRNFKSKFPENFTTNHETYIKHAHKELKQAMKSITILDLNETLFIDLNVTDDSEQDDIADEKLPESPEMQLALNQQKKSEICSNLSLVTPERTKPWHASGFSLTGSSSNSTFSMTLSDDENCCHEPEKQCTGNPAAVPWEDYDALRQRDWYR